MVFAHTIIRLTRRGGFIPRHRGAGVEAELVLGGLEGVEVTVL
jgi:hypothetical protein